ncbi:IGHMBP2 family helicase [Archaeoglobus veneficus]|uniref:DNA helicase n=1 Tax=Archaeoglobus veneficus (strain DSM 11195 / SNP6) TaxID=693661 RepID=F2KSY0_ARCVS|nr:IGHMBP2 family helicase [Archaeoglobus veneficus]AEA48124.1 DNA helicase [Archaeoglobus veneficus SNP6]
MDVDSYISRLRKLVELERRAEIESMKEEMRKLSGYERERRGRAILRLNGKVIGREFGYKLVKYGRKERIETEISVGDLVVISKGDPLKSDLIATVVEKGTRYIVVSIDSIPEWALKNVRIDLYANDITLKRMIENLEKLSESGKRTLRFLLGIERPRKPKAVNFEPFDNKLNESQREAVSLALGSRDFFLIHGPFGTGKTRTLTELILQEVKRGNKVLATAESNVAVDNLVERLAGKVRLVRLGHPSRISRHLIESSIFFQVEKHERFAKAEKLRDEAEKLIRQRDSEVKPSPHWRRGLSDEEIVKAAERGKRFRGIPYRVLKSMAKWIKLNREIQKLLDEAREIEEEIAREIINSSQVVLATNSSAALELIKDVEFDVAVIDEASQATIPSVLIPISKTRRFVLAGDHKQLPPTVLSQEAAELSETLFEKLIEAYPENSKMLEVQYRMNKKLMEFPSREFYGGRLKADDSVRNITLADLGVKEPKFGFWNEVLGSEPLVFIDTSKCADRWERQRKGSPSRENELEARIIKELVERLLKIGVKAGQIGVITPYDDQVDLIKRYIKGIEEIEVKTVDGYQGREKDVIIISFVRSNERGEVGFLDDLRRLNVSLTRARRKLIAIGDTETLSTNETYRRFIEFVKKEGKLVSLSAHQCMLQGSAKSR